MEKKESQQVSQGENFSSHYSDENKVSYLNKILRGEISAVEAYQQVLEKFKDDAEAMHLLEIKNDHHRNIEKLQELIEKSDDVSDTDSGVWGTVVATIVGAAKLAGNVASLKALIEGEEHGLNEYREALNYNLSENERRMIELDFIPAQERHIVHLRTLEAIQ